MSDNIPVHDYILTAREYVIIKLANLQGIKCKRYNVSSKNIYGIINKYPHMKQ